ncbi:MAG: leucine-rich repeat domain-containing protein [Clostridia bacterium]|nr:leucine-rich repeat domain-containing protein [Oscillospiraceae bacterium]MBQ2772775.1 leucine-rich repeat domain-containing protein [Clostridia bacterium]MBQ3056891.1 leucine-rich repeat domain-containing protein [Clostridia bacterium]
MKKIFAILLALLLVCSFVACSDEEVEKEDGTNLTVTDTEHHYNAGGTYNDRFVYEIINGNQVAIVGFESDYTPHDVVIPATIENCPVVEISDAAFYHCSQLKTITVPITVTKIGKMAFAGCVQLTAVKYVDNTASSIRTIDEYAFAYCESLSSITLPDTLTVLGEGAFFQCKALPSIDIPAVVRDAGGNVQSGVVTISDMAFMGCESLTTVTGGEGVETIGNYAFRGCAELASVSLSAVLTEIGDYAFSGCTALTQPTLGEGVTVGEYAFE